MDFAIYVLDDYAVHLMPEVRRALYDRGYVLFVMGGGITGDLQVNDTHTHRALKRHYRDEEAELMLSKLNENSHKIPSPDRSEIIDMTIKAWNKISVDYPRTFKQNFITCAFDGSEDYLVSDNIFRLVGEDMIEFRGSLLRESVPNTLKSVVKNMIPPKGIGRNNVEGAELLDYMDEDCDENLEENASDGDLAEYGDTDEPVASTSNPELSDNIRTAADSFEGPAHAGFVPLSNRSANPEINGDAMFLDAFGNLMESHQTSTMFLPHLTKLRSVYDVARRSVKRRIEEESK